MEADAADATLELTVISIDNHKNPNLLSKSSSSTPFAIAWIDPKFKRSTKTLTLTLAATTNNNLHFPLSPSILRNPSSVLTIQILAPRFPFQRAKLVGAAALPISSVRLGGSEIYNLQVRKSSGRGCGSIRVKVRILWCLGILDPNPMELSSGDLIGSERFDFSTYSIEPSAPPMSEERIGVDSEVPLFERGDFDCKDGILKLATFKSRDFDCLNVDYKVETLNPPNFGPDSTYIIDHAAPLISERRDFGCLNVDSECLYDEAKGFVKSGESGGSECFEEIGQRIEEDEKKNGKGVWRSFLVGMVSGAFAAILVGVAGFSED